MPMRQPEEVFWGTTQAEGGQKNADWSPSQSGDQARDRLPTPMRKPVSEEKDSQVFGIKNCCTELKESKTNFIFPTGHRIGRLRWD